MNSWLAGKSFKNLFWIKFLINEKYLKIKEIIEYFI